MREALGARRTPKPKTLTEQAAEHVAGRAPHELRLWIARACRANWGEHSDERDALIAACVRELARHHGAVRVVAGGHRFTIVAAAPHVRPRARGRRDRAGTRASPGAADEPHPASPPTGGVNPCGGRGQGSPGHGEAHYVAHTSCAASAARTPQRRRAGRHLGASQTPHEGGAVVNTAHRIAVPAFACDRCQRPANVITIQPSLSRPPTKARVTCGRHAPRDIRAYQFDLGQWFEGPDDWWRPGPHTMKRHLLDVKIHGELAVRLVDAALARALVLEERAA